MSMNKNVRVSTHTRARSLGVIMAVLTPARLPPRGHARAAIVTDPVTGHLVELAGDAGAEQPGLLAVLAGPADPRARWGVRYRLIPSAVASSGMLR
jgi:hypothetical protein